jgi:hypothetical protein
MFGKLTYCLDRIRNAFRCLFSEANGLIPERTCYVITDIIDVDLNIPKEHIRNLFSNANDVWFLCKTNLGRFATVGF